MKKCVVLLLIIAFTVSMMVIAIGCKEETVEETTAAEITEAETTAAETTGAETTTAEKALKIGISFPVIDHPYFLEIDSGFDAAEKEFNVVYIKTDAQLDVNKQLSDVEDLVTQQVEGLIAMPLDPTSIIPAIETANNAGIPVVTVDLGAAGGEIAAHVASDNYEGGRLVAQFLIEQ
ncbi:MAG: sugar ABC transporter substrate-binding protein [Actinobacteria bacterium]|nr:sugar ABC transporter substrate-binding protein [Actinomycetota bacterium]